MSDVAIDISELNVTYREGKQTIEALRGLSIQIEEGEKVAVIGPSGSGKSTLVKVLAGLVEPSSGGVRIRDQIVDGEVTAQFYQNTGAVLQEHGLVPQLSALKNVLCGRLYEYQDTDFRGFDAELRKQAVDYLKRLGLGKRLHLPASQLSGGEKQRVALARLLVQKPSVALLDEPVSDLDVHWAKESMEIVNELGAETTTIMVAHNLEMAQQWADRVICLHDGEMTDRGDPTEICAKFRQREETLGVGSGELENETRESGGGTGERDSGLGTCDWGFGIGDSAAESGDWYKIGFYIGLAIATVAVYTWAAVGAEFSPAKIFGNVGSAADFIGRMLPPDLSSDVVKPVGESLIETVQMALIGTTMAAFISIPLAVMAARNISPRPVRAIARVILNGLRTIPSIIWGLFFVAIVGLGPFPGILALTFYAAGYLGKFYYEAIEEIDPGPLRALKTVGAGPIQLFRFGVWPQVLPLFLGYTLYMFEYNIRSASVLGIVGAGGIGFYIYTYINNFDYPKATTALIALLIVVTVIDFASSRLRRMLAVD